jgi:hypothetical protein
MFRAALASAACFRTHRTKPHGRSRGDCKETREFWRIREGSGAGSAVAISRRVTVRTVKPNDFRLDGDVRGDVMQALAGFARHLVSSLLVIWLVSLGAPCAAQELDAPAAPAAPDAGDGRGPVFAPGGFLGLFTPVRDRIALNLYGFYYGEVKAPVAQVDVPIRTTKFLTITPSYLYYEVPPSGLNKASEHPAGFTDTFEENQFRIDATVKFSIRGFEIADRNMYVRRFRPTDEINRYRHRIGIAHPLAVNGHIWKAFANYEAFYERQNGGWNRNRVAAGVTLPLQKHVAFQPSYIWEHNRVRGLRDINYLQFGLIVSTK